MVGECPPPATSLITTRCLGGFAKAGQTKCAETTKQFQICLLLRMMTSVSVLVLAPVSSSLSPPPPVPPFYHPAVVFLPHSGVLQLFAINLHLIISLYTKIASNDVDEEKNTRYKNVLPHLHRTGWLTAGKLTFGLLGRRRQPANRSKSTNVWRKFRISVTCRCAQFTANFGGGYHQGNENEQRMRSSSGCSAPCED